MNLSKFFLRSKTILFNAALLLVGVWHMVEGSLGHLKASISPATYGVLMAVVGIIGIVLRLVTTTALTAKPKP